MADDVDDLPTTLQRSSTRALVGALARADDKATRRACGDS